MHRSVGFASVALVLLVGCASSTETLRGADEGTETTTSSGLSEIETQPLSETSPESAATTSAVCTAGETRSCKQTWTDAQGTNHCQTKTQFCSAQGSGWLPCGELPTQEDAGSN